MSKSFLLILSGALMFSFFSKSEAKETLAENAYAFEFPSLTSDTPIKFSDYKGKIMLVVNVASECGFTPQYKELEQLYEIYKENLVVIGVPSDQFGHQEKGTNQEIATFCESKFGVKFPMAAKTDVKGETAAPFYIWARKKLGALSAPKWNFSKYLVDREGKLVDFYISTTTPMDKKITNKIDELIGKPKP